MNFEKAKERRRQRKVYSLRKGLDGKGDRPRLAVFRSHKNISCQVIDDIEGKTLVACSSQEKDMLGALKGMKKAEKAARIGEEIAKRAQAKGIKKVVFDRRWYQFHGRVKALAEGARKAGLNF